MMSVLYKAEQLSLWELFDKPQRSIEQEDILYAINRGSGYEYGKIRILNYYNAYEPSNKEFADYLCREYGQGGCSLGFEFGDQHDASGIKFRREGRQYQFNWQQFAKEVAKVIDNDEYDALNNVRDKFYKSKNYEFWTRKSFYETSTYNNKKIICANLSTCFEKPKGYIEYGNSNLLKHTQIFIGEIVRAIESGAYNSTDEIWEDIKSSERFINGATFGGRKWEDEDGIKRYFENFKKTGYAQQRKSLWTDEEIRDWEFWCSRARQKGIIDCDGRKVV